MRAERMAQLGLLRAIHPDRVTQVKLMSAVTEELNADAGTTYEVDLNGMSRVASSLYGLLDDSACVGYTIHDSRRDDGLVVDLHAPLFVLRRAEGGGSLSEKEVAHSLAVSASASVLRESIASD